MKKKCQNFLSAALLTCSVFYTASVQAAPLTGSLPSKAPLINSPLASKIVLNQRELVDAQEFVDRLANSAIQFLDSDQISYGDKIFRFKDLLNSRFDMKTIARFALGRYWRVASEEQRDEYVTLFNDMIVEVYSRRFADYNGQELKILSSRGEGNSDAIVQSVIVQKNQPDIHIDWRVRNINGKQRVIDVIVAGVSMALTQRSDFSSVIQRGGGEIDVLLEHLRTMQIESQEEAERIEAQELDKHLAQ